MDCNTARQVYVKGAETPKSFVKQLSKVFPDMVEFFEVQVQNFLSRRTNPFHEKVKELSCVKENFYTLHLEDDDPLTGYLHDVLGDAAARFLLGKYFSEKYNQEINLNAICCSACNIFSRLTSEQSIKIQFAAVKVEPDGTIV